MKRTIFLLILILIVSCVEKEPVDMLIKNGVIYTVDEDNPIAEVVAIRDGKIVFAGSESDARKYEGEILDLEGKAMYPGFQEGHAHLMGVGYNLLNVDLMGTQSYAEIVEKVKERAASTPKGEWILGRGWHQDKWTDNPERIYRSFPTHHDLSEAVPNHPVLLRHASGHLALANAKAMELAGVTTETTQPDGGEIFMGLDGPTGIFNETAQGIVGRVVPSNDEGTARQALELAINECLKYGITGFHDAGSGDVVDLYKSFGEEGKMDIRLHMMLRGNLQTMAEYFEKGPDIGLYGDHLTIRSIKMAADGALGSRGAWLIEEYTDAPGEYGHEVEPMTHIDSLTQKAYEAGFQVCIHAIGDRANKEVLDLYERTFQKGLQDDPRYRIEHAQHLHPDDIPRFAELGVLPIMQAIHMSSDRPWAINRLGKARITEGAYMWKDLLESGAKIVNGTDAPVEPLDPLPSFYASVSRRTLKGTPEGGYEPGQKMTREEALKSYTLDAAYGAFMDEIIGSIEAGKYADFTVFDKDIMTIPEDEILLAKVEMTIIDGQVMYRRN